MIIEETETQPPVNNSPYPENCQKCGLCETARTWKMRPLGDKRTNEDLPPQAQLLVVMDRPYHLDDQMGSPLADSERNGALLKKLLNSLEVRWSLSYSAKCWPGFKEGSKITKQPTAVQYKLCNPYLVADIEKINPDVIVALGVESMKAVMGKNAPASLKAAGKAPLQMEGMDTYVLVSRAPGIPEYAKNSDGEKAGITDAQYNALIDEYLRVFGLAERICKEGWEEQEVRWALIRNRDEAIRKFRSLTADEVFIDVETSQPLKGDNPEAITMWHPDCELICVACSWMDIDGEMNTIVVAGPAMCADVMTIMVGGRNVYAHSAKYELQAFWIYFKLDLFLYAKSVGCTMMEVYMPDQDNQQNALKGLCVDHLCVSDWSLEIWSMVQQIYDQRTDRIDWLLKEEKRRARVLAKIESGKPVFKKSGNKLVKDAAGNKVADDPSSWPPLEAPPKPYVDFRDVPLYSLSKYNAGDTHNTGRLLLEYIRKSPAEYDPIARLLVTKSMHALSRVERRGMPVSLKHVTALKEACLQNIRNISWRLIQEPEVQEAITVSPDALKASKRAIRKRNPIPFTTEDMLGWIKFQGVSKFYEQLVRSTVGEEAFPKTDKGKISSNIKSMMDVAELSFELDLKTGQAVFKSRIPEENRNRYHEIWRLYIMARKSLDLISKFLDELERYTVNDLVHTDYIMAKVERSGDAGDAGGVGTNTGRLSCVAEGSFVEMPRDVSNHPEGIPIEDVKVGDLVYSYDDKGELSLRKVLGAAKTGVRETIELHWTNSGHTGRTGVLRLTPEHRVRRLNGTWERADNLKPGDRVMTLSPQNQEIIAITTGPTVPVYDLTVEDTECFIANGLAVHNSRRPNVQNIKHDVLLRSCFRAGKGWKIAELDFDRMEPVCLAVMANIPAWKRIFAPDGHWLLYREIANDVYQLGIQVNDDIPGTIARLKAGVTDQQREISKVSALAIMYGESPYGFAYRTGLPLEQVNEFFSSFYRAYPEIEDFQNKIKADIRSEKIIKTLFGRKRSFPLGTAWKGHGRVFRQGINFPVQSLASDICLWKLYEIFEWIDVFDLEDSIHPINIVHDAIWFEVREEVLQQHISSAAVIMEDVSTLPFDFPLPMRVSPKIGNDLGDMKKPDFNWRK